MLKRWLKRAAIAVVLLAVAGVLAAVIWWRVSGKEFLYGAIVPDAKALLGKRKVPEEVSADAFRRDLAFLEAELPRLHVGYERAFDGEAVSARIAELTAEADSLTPEQRTLELFGVLALGGTGTGHPMVFPIQRSLDWRIYPLTTFSFADGLFVTMAETRYLDAVSRRIARIGGVPVAEALEMDSSIRCPHGWTSRRSSAWGFQTGSGTRSCDRPPPAHAEFTLLHGGSGLAASAEAGAWPAFDREANYCAARR